MQITRHDRLDQLFQIADQQQGLFTTQQAVQAGYQRKSHFFHERSGNWIREHRGIYRLSRYPSSLESQYVLWHLWSRDIQGKPQGVLSHETALSIYDLSDLNPSKIHVTVPKKFRRSANIPSILILHYRDLETDHVNRSRGFQVTTPIRTVIDLILDQTTSWEFIIQAVQEGIQKGLILRKDLKAIEKIKEQTPQVQEMVNHVLKVVNR